ncbi:MAG: hypothetical protein KDK36_07910, partial [Leptospiraceae bacterium]|nr:hypothetical protein [Leptospiraceae bacterium]
LQLVGVIGKTVFSSGGGGMFPANLPVGVVIEEGPREGSFKTAYIKPLVNFEELEYVTIIKKLPAKWEESWPEDKEVKIDNPLYGELDFPGEEPEKEKPEEPIKPPEKKEVKKTTAKPAEKEAKPKKETTPAKKTNDGNKSILDMDEDFLLKKLEEGGN